MGIGGKSNHWIGGFSHRLQFNSSVHINPPWLIN